MVSELSSSFLHQVVFRELLFENIISGTITSKTGSSDSSLSSSTQFLSYEDLAFQSELNGLIPKDPELYTENDILLKEKDDKSYDSISMALSADVAHGFNEHETAKQLWDALVERFEVNEDMRESRKNMLRQWFNMFNHFKREYLVAQLNRFTHLMTEMTSAGIEIFKGEVNKKLLNSLPYN
ncbi:hypothetical protein R6Q57_009170 [Mikania cordata]